MSTRMWFRLAMGKIYRLAGIPGLVRVCAYSSTSCSCEIRVQTTDLFTIISVNDLDIYFHRLTGSIDGVGSCRKETADV